MTLEGSPTAALTRAGILLFIVALAYFGLTRIHPEPVAAREGTSVIHPWAKGGVGTGGAMPMYVVLENKGATTERLVGVSSPMADRVIMSKLSREGGLMRAVELEDVQLPPGARLAFRPGERQITLLGARTSIEPGNYIPLTFTFARGGELTANLRVENMGEPEHDDHF